jgi:His-Xaa-Ser system protein HxsD
MEEDIVVVDNLEIHKKDNFVTISINPNLYPLEVIYSAAYIFINRAYVMIDGHPEGEILVQLRPKTNINTDAETLGREFNNELINYMTYLQRAARSQNIRESILKRALETNSQSEPSKSIESAKKDDLTQKTYIEDPEKIAKPWMSKDQKG